MLAVGSAERDGFCAALFARRTGRIFHVFKNCFVKFPSGGSPRRFIRQSRGQLNRQPGRWFVTIHDSHAMTIVSVFPQCSGATRILRMRCRIDMLGQSTDSQPLPFPTQPFMKVGSEIISSKKAADSSSKNL